MTEETAETSNHHSVTLQDNDYEVEETSSNIDLPEELFKPVDDINLSDYVPVPPDGGWGWVIVFASFMANLIVDGIGYAFGVLFNEFQQQFKSTKATTALVGSLLTGCYLLVGPIVSGLVNRFGSRPVMMFGGLLSGVGFFVSVFANSILALIITYGIVGGVGFGLIYLPAIVHVGYYFERKRALATGLAVSGSGVGTFVFAPFCVYLLSEYGWRGSLWLLSGLILNCIVFGALLRPLKPRRDPSELQEKIIKREERLKLALSRMTGMDLVDDVVTDSPIITGNRDSEESESHIPSGPSGTRRVSLNRQDVQKFARVRSTLSDSSENPTIHIDSPQKALPVVEEGKPMDITAQPQSSRHRTTSLHYSSKYSVTGGHGHDLHRHSSHVSALSYASSLQRLSSAGSALTAAQSIFSLSGVNPADFARPLYRQDILYTGSITKLHQFHASKNDLNLYRQSQISIPTSQYYNEAVDVPVSEHLASMEQFDEGMICYFDWIPSAVRGVLSQMLHLDLLRQPTMLLLCVSNIFGFLGFYVPFVFLSNRAIAFGVDQQQAAFLLSIIGITNTLGRIFFGWFADRGWISALNISNMSLLACGFLTLMVPFFYQFISMAIYAAVFGFFIAAYICLTSIILVDLLGLENLTNSFGLLILSRGISAIIGSPIAGAVYDMTNSYGACFYFSGALIIGSGLVSCLIPLLNRCDKSDDGIVVAEHSTRLSTLRENSEEP